MKDLDQFTVTVKASLREVAALIDSNAAKIAIVLDGSGTVVGTISDGDLRRGMLDGVPFEAPASKVLNTSFSFVESTHEEAQVLALMRERRIHQIPVLSDNGKLLDLLLWDEFFKRKTIPNTMIIMAGGEGKRLRPLTKNCPKPMLKVGGKPILEIILERCIDSGFENFLFSVNYLKHMIIDHFGNGSDWSVNIGYLEEVEPLGTAGALSLVGNEITDPVVVMNGDLLTQIDFSELLSFHNKADVVATVCVRNHEVEVPFGVVENDGTLVSGFDEKPIYSYLVNAGIYVLNEQVIRSVGKSTYCDMPQLLESHVESGQKVAAFPLRESWLDIGHPDALRSAESNL